MKRSSPASSPARTAPRPRGGSRRPASLLRRVLGYTFLAGLVGLVGLAVLVFAWTRDLPDYRQLESLRLKATSRVLARDGAAVGSVVPVDGDVRVNRTLVSLAEVSQAARSAIVSSEDRDFYRHHGFDPTSLARSLLSTLRGHPQGGSTITAQFVRSTILDSEDSLRRKVRELVLSIQVDRFLSKDEILAGYLNSVYWGGNLSGIAAAARAYFDKRPIDLSLAEGVYLASLLPAPNSRFADLEFVRGQVMKSRLERLVEDGRVSRAEADAAWLEPLRPRGWAVRYDGQGTLLSATLVDRTVTRLRDTSSEAAPHFMLEVRRFLKGRIPDGAFEQGGLTITTTLDLRAQRAVNEAARRASLPPGAGAQLAVAAVDPASGEVLAMYGGRPGEDGSPGEFNRATESRRSPGSSVKPLLYAAAIEAGRRQWDTFLDGPLEHPDPSQPGGLWRPKNFSGTSLGYPVTMRYALDHSLNLPTVRLGQALGLPAFRDKLRGLGLEGVKDDLNLSSTLGGGLGVSPLQMASAYASLANGGTWIEPRFVRRVEDAQGRVLYSFTGRNAAPRRAVWTSQTAAIALDMLRGVVNDPPPYGATYATGARVGGREVGGKTGTSSDQKDLWFVGVTPGLSAAVWIGRDDNQAMSESVYSGTYAPPVWRDFVSGALAGRAAASFPTPRGVAYQYVKGVRMAYRFDPPAARPAPVPAVAEPEPAPVEPPPVAVEPPQAEAPVAVPSEPAVVLQLNVCASPVALADERTAPECVEARSVPAGDVALYQPVPQAAPVEPTVPVEPSSPPADEDDTPTDLPLAEPSAEPPAEVAPLPAPPAVETPLPDSPSAESAPETVPPEPLQQDTTPQDTTPQDAVPQDAVPQDTDTAPQDTAPQDTAPQDAAPQDTLPENTVPPAETSPDDPLASPPDGTETEPVAPTPAPSF